MLVKYYGEMSYRETETLVPRYTFLEDGLFRFTQPIFLNDKNEMKFFPRFNRFSPVDIAWARNRYLQEQFNNKENIPSVEMLENMYLKPTGLRYGESFPFMLKDQTGFETMDEYDEYQFKTMVSRLNQVIVEALSCNIGVFSLSKNVTNKLMWTHYGSEGRGIAINFKEEHPYFLFNQANKVSYDPVDRASFTYYKGSIRLNGEPVDNLKISQTSSIGIFNELISNGVDVHDLVERLIYSKEEDWWYEEEVRIVSTLENSHTFKGDKFKPNIDSDIKSKIMIPDLLKEHSTICLNKIPFDAFESIIFGHSVSNQSKDIIWKTVKANSSLAHLKIQEVYHDIFGDLQLRDAYPV